MYSSILIHFPKLSTHHTSHHQGIFLVNIITVRCPISDYIQNDIFAHVLKFSPNTQSLNSIKKSCTVLRCSEVGLWLYILQWLPAIVQRYARNPTRVEH